MKLRQHTKAIVQLLFLLLFCAPMIQAQNTVDQTFTKSTTQKISLNDKNLSAKSTQFNQSIDLGEYGVYDLSLEQTYLFSDAYIARKANKNNDEKLPLTFKGTIQGQPNTLVSLTTNIGFLSGFIDTGEEVIFFEPYKNFDSDAQKNELIIYYQKDVIDKGHTCVANHTDEQATQIKPKNDQFKSAAAGCYEVEMVLVADYGMYQKHGASTLNHITSVLNNVKANYDNEFNDPITFVVVDDYIAKTSGQNLWSSTLFAPTLLNEFRDSDFTNVTYDLASLWVTRDIWNNDDNGVRNDNVVGLAKRPGVCGSRYNLIEDFSSSSAKLRAAFAHEIGHNFSAEHDAEGSSTIMAPSVDVTNTWSTKSKNAINAFYPTATCLCASGDAADLAFRSCGTSNSSGNTLTISGVEVKNNGTISADAVKVGWYLSTDNNITTSDYLIGTRNTPILQVNNYTTLGLTANLANIPPGNYYLGTIIDYEDSLVEFSEDNNIGCISSSANITITVTQPDLQISACGASFSSGTTRFYNNVIVSNSGTTTSGTATLGVYLSSNNTVNTSDYRVATASIPALSGGTTSSHNLSFNTATVTGVPAGNYYVGLIADSGNTVTESNENNNVSCVSSSASITIPPGQPQGTITVTAPGGSDTFKPGDVINIKWTDNISENVSIRMYNSGGSSWNVSSSTASDGNFNYTIPTSRAPGQYRIYIQSTTNSSINDYGDYFTIQTPPPTGTITVTAPGGSDTFKPGDVINIKWTDNISENVLIRMYTSTGSYFTLTNSTASDGSFNYTIPTSRAPGQYRIYIQSTTNSSINDYGDYFTIQTPPPTGTITVTAPGGSDTFKPGDVINIKWTDNISENVSIRMYNSGGSSWNVSSSTASDGSFNYTIPTSRAPGQYRIYIRSTTNSSINDYGDYFTIQTPPPTGTITVTAPGGSDSFKPGDVINIKWTDNISENVLIRMYSSAGWYYNITSSTLSDGSHTYTTLSSVPDGQYRIYIQSTTNSSINDYGDYFTIQTPPPTGTITVTAPGGSDTFKPGDVINIKWTDNISENVLIRMYTSTGSYFTLTNSTASDGSFNYTIPTSRAPGQYRIYIQSITNSSINDYGDYFTIQTPPPTGTITVTAPGGSDTFNPGDVINIKWTDNISENVLIRMYSSAGWYYNITSSTLSDGSHTYTTLSSVPDGQYRIYIQSTTNSSINDYGDYFTIQTPPPTGTITVTAPGGSDTFKPGDVINIKWTDNISENVLIRIYTSTGSYFTLTNSTASDGSFNYTIPTSRAPGQYRIYIQSISNSSINDYGDYFTIQTPPPTGTITVTTPGGSDSFKPGDVINIKWTDNISENVSIRMYNSGGSSWNVSSSTASDGSFNYTIPTSRAPGQYRIYIQSTTNSSINDYGDYFTIQQQAEPNLCGDDNNTLLHLPFDYSRNGTGGETPTASQYVSLGDGKYSNGANIIEYSDTPTLKYEAANNINSQQGTVEAWVKPTWNGNDGKGHTILQYGAEGGMLILKDGANNLRLIINRFSPSGYPEQGVGHNISDWQANQWRHIAFTWGGGQLRLYIDGNLTVQQPIYSTPLFPISDTEFNIGTDAGWNVWQGTIDHLRISNVVRSRGRILEFMYNCEGDKIEQEGYTLETHSYPNPFTDHATIMYTLPKESPVTLNVYNSEGKQVASLYNNEIKTAGTHTTAFEANALPAGMYYYTIEAGEYFGTQKMILMK